MCHISVKQLQTFAKHSLITSTCSSSPLERQQPQGIPTDLYTSERGDSVDPTVDTSCQSQLCSMYHRKSFRLLWPGILQVEQDFFSAKTEQTCKGVHPTHDIDTEVEDFVKF